MEAGQWILSAQEACRLLGDRMIIVVQLNQMLPEGLEDWELVPMVFVCLFPQSLDRTLGHTRAMPCAETPARGVESG